MPGGARAGNMTSGWEVMAACLGRGNAAHKETSACAVPTLL